MNVFDLLRQDHQRLRDIFSRLAQTERLQKKVRLDLFQELKRELIAHSHAEERVFYPKLVDKPPTHDLIEEGIIEHHQVEKLLGRVEAMPAGTEEWTIAVRDLSQMVEHHFREEEGQVFPQAEKLLPDDQFDPIGDQVKQVEDQEKQRTPQ